MPYQTTDLTDKKLLGALNDLEAYLGETVKTEPVTISAADWTTDANINPFTVKATKTLSTTVNINTVLSISMDTVTQARNGIAIGVMSGQDITLYAVVSPTESVSVTIIFEE